MEDQFEQQEEKGQSLVIFAVLMVVLIALAALAIDGGFSLAKRREAQNAADSGALAGAAILCEGGTQDEARAQAIDYAGRNGAAYPAPVIGFGQRGITVTTTITHDTFLAGIFGIDIVSPRASASAGCYIPCNISGILPIAWLCQTPPGPGFNGCGVQYGDPSDPNALYVIMDSINTANDVCQDPITHLPSAGWDCDLNNDGANDLMAGSDATGGNRSWLDLNGGGGGSSELVDWVLGRYGGTLTKHTWYGGQTGVTNNVFQAVGTVVGQIVFLPVYDSLPCSGRPDIYCPTRFHTNPPDDAQDTIVFTGGDSSTLYYHVVSFSAFLVTCVEAPGIPGNPDCPGKNLARTVNPGIPENTKTIEGYFVQYDAGSGRCEGFDAGVHTIYLNK